MDSAKVLKSCKRYESKKSQRFSNIARICWSKAQAKTPEVNDTIYLDSINSYSPSDNNTESTKENEPTEEREDNDVENVVPVEDHGDNVTDMEINPEIENNELIYGVAWISGMPEASVSAFDSVHLNNTSTDDADYDVISSDSTDSSDIDSSSEYYPTPLKKPRVSPVDLGNRQFIDQINETSVCYTSMCSGKLVPVHVKSLGFGGCAELKFSCSDCGE